MFNICRQRDGDDDDGVEDDFQQSIKQCPLKTDEWLQH